MKKLLLVGVLPLTLTGCWYQSVSGYEIEKATKYCQNFGGVEKILEDWLGETAVRCVDKEEKVWVK